MDAVFLKEHDCITSCFHPSLNTILILKAKVATSLHNLEIIELEILTQTICKRFVVPRIDKIPLLNINYDMLAVESGYGYHLFINEGRVFLSYPNACLAIYDYESSHLIHIFQTHGKNAYVITAVAFTPPRNVSTSSFEQLLISH